MRRRLVFGFFAEGGELGVEELGGERAGEGFDGGLLGGSEGGAGGGEAGGGAFELGLADGLGGVAAGRRWRGRRRATAGARGRARPRG